MVRRSQIAAGRSVLAADDRGRNVPVLVPSSGDRPVVAFLRQSTRRALGIRTAALVFILLAGATYQGVATALERREFPRPGGLVNIGNHQLHIYCTGWGSGGGAGGAGGRMTAAWGEVQRRLSKHHARLQLRPQRPGLERDRRPAFDAARVPANCATLLTRANEPGPFVVAGHGLGAVFARAYAARPDSRRPPHWCSSTCRPMRPDPQPGWIIPASPWLARAGVLRAGGCMSSKADGLPSGGALQRVPQPAGSSFPRGG